MKINIKNSDSKIIFLKGSKIVHVKSSKRSKAHIRRIKISDKSKESRLKNQLNFFENYIKSQDFESCSAYNKYGEIIFQKDGGKDKISFTEEERLKQKGSIFTHNHPIGQSFSPADIRWSCQAELKEMRVISKNGNQFTMKMKDGNNFNMKLWNEKINLTQDAMNNQVREEFINKINDKEMTIQECDDAHWDEVWRRVVKEIPEILYGWVI